MTRTEEKTEFEQNLKFAQESEKVIYYDYLSYKRGAGWWTGLRNDDWHRPIVIKKAKYNGEFLRNLLDYYFLGFPLKELLKQSYANGHCHACAVALSLYFDDFEIITCNLENYVKHYSIKSGQKIDEYEHSFLLINSNDKKTVIDTTFGFITDYDTYKIIFKPNKIRILTSQDLEKVEPYQYIKSLKYYKGAPLGFNEVYDEENNEWIPTEEEIKYKEIIRKYMDMCSNYKNKENTHLQDFINRCLFRTSNNATHWNWRNHLQYGKKIEYPETRLSSLEDDEYDIRLDGAWKETIERNKKVLENHHKEQALEKKVNSNNLKNKILKLVQTIKH